MTTNRHGVATFDFATVSGCDQLVVGLTHARGGTLDLLMTDVPDFVRVSVVASMGNSDHSSLSAVISMAQAVPNLCESRKVFLKHQDRPMSPQFRKVHHPLLLPITDQLPSQQYCLNCLSAWCRLVLDDLWNAVVSFQPPSLVIGKFWVPVMHFCACPIHGREHWRVGRRLGSCRLTSVQLLIGSTIWAFSIISALWVLEVLSCLY